MRHAVLGTGGVGGLIAAALARAEREVVLLMRPETFARYRGRLEIESTVLGNFQVGVPAALRLEHEVDVLWVTVKTTQLEHAVKLAPPELLVNATVVPLLNGIDHVGFLRSRYANVVAGTIRVESERVPPWRIRQTSPFLRVELAGAAAVTADLAGAGIATRTRDDEPTVLWEKPAFLAPLALATTALDAPLGAVRHDERYQHCQSEVLAVARAERANVDAEGVLALSLAAPDGMQSSMQKDVAAGRAPELEAIAGPVLRGGERHAIPVPATTELARLVQARITV